MTAYEEWAALPEEQQEQPETETADTGAGTAEEAAAAGETASESATEEETEAETEAEAEKAPESEDEQLPKGLKKRFRQLTGKIRELETQLAQRSAPPGTKQETAIPAPAAESANAPKQEDYDSYDAYVRAQVRHEMTLEREQFEQRTRADEAAKAWKKKLDQTKDRVADYEDVLADSDVQVSRSMHDAILDSEIGPDLIYHLAKHPAEAARIQKLSPNAQIREMGKLEVKLTTPVTSKAAVSKAPPPPKTVGGSAQSDPGKEPDPKNFSAWSKWQDRQEALAR